MMINELSKRFDEELAQVHHRLDSQRDASKEWRDGLDLRYSTARDSMLETIHDLKNCISGMAFRIRSLEKHPPVIPDEQPNDHTPIGGPPG